MFETLKRIDTGLFLDLNDFYSPFFDTLMWWISSHWLWIPLYLFIIYWAIKKFGKKAFLIIPIIILTFVLCDELAYFIKQIAQRYRPTHNRLISDFVHTINDYKGGLYSFPSSHATNTFGVATIVALIFRHKYFSRLIFIWPVIVSYSRIYLGVHYPSDLFCGMLLGIFIALVMYILYLYLFKKFRFSST